MVAKRILIDYEKCTYCKKCVKACKYGVLDWLDEAPIVTNPNKCKGCSECEKNCSVKAINIYE